MLSAHAEGDTVEDVPVSGTVRREDGAEHPFVGWVNLMALLHDAVVLTQAGSS
jgi:hypothetical protein